MSRKVRKARFMRITENEHCDAAARFEINLDLPLDLMKSVADRSVTNVDVSVMAPTKQDAERLTAAVLEELIGVLSNELASLKRAIK